MRGQGRLLRSDENESGGTGVQGKLLQTEVIASAKGLRR